MTYLPSSTQKRKKNKRLQILLVILAAFILVFAVIAGTIFAFGKHAADTFDGQTEVLSATEVFPASVERPAENTTGAKTILLLGTDEDDGTGVPSATNVPADGAAALTVVQIAGDREDISFISIPRDTLVTLEDRGDTAIGDAVTYGGIPSSVAAVEDLLEIRIDNVALIDFTGFKSMTDALGGVEVENPTSVTTTYGGYNLPAGTVNLNGNEALAFVREKYEDAENGGVQHARNQQLYIQGLAKEIFTPATITNPGRVQDTIEAISPYLAVDENFRSGYFVNLAPSLVNIRSDDLLMLSLPTQGEGLDPDGDEVIILDQQELGKLKSALQSDTIAEYLSDKDEA